jgi:hypothetical protein
MSLYICYTFKFNEIQIIHIIELFMAMVMTLFIKSLCNSTKKTNVQKKKFFVENKFSTLYTNNRF